MKKILIGLTLFIIMVCLCILFMTSCGSPDNPNTPSGENPQRPNNGVCVGDNHSFSAFETQDDGTAWAQCANCDTVQIQNDTGTLTCLFEKNGDGYSFGEGKGDVTSFTVPAAYKGAPVNRVRNNALLYVLTLTSIEIPSTVTHIETNAFPANLKEILIPESVTKCAGAFITVRALDKVTVPINMLQGLPFNTASEVHITGTGTATQGMFRGDLEIGSLVFGEGITVFERTLWDKYSTQNKLSVGSLTIHAANATVDSSAFNSWNITALSAPASVFNVISQKNLKEVSIISGDEVTMIDCEMLEKLYLAETVTHFKTTAAFDTLTEIIVNENNPNLYVSNNCLISKSDKTLLLGANTSKIPNDGNVEKIGAYAFAKRTELRDLTFPDSLTEIGERAFYGCTGLYELTFPANTSVIGKEAFCNCEGIYKISVLTTGSFEIGESAFSGCYKAVEVVNLSTREIEAESLENSFIGRYAKHVTDDPAKSNIVKNGDFVFYIDHTGAFLVAYLGSAEHVVLPERPHLDGYVFPGYYYIYKYAFARNKTMRSVTIDNNVAIIHLCAFSRCTNLESVRFDNATQGYMLDIIERDAFAWCENLKYVELPAKLAYHEIGLEKNAFYEATSLTAIFFGGDGESEEEATFVGEFANKLYLADATVYFYSEYRPSEAGNYWHYVDGVATIWE